MSRHRAYSDDDSGGEAPVEELVSLDPLLTYRPLKKPGPDPTLTEAKGLAICARVAAGRTLRDAASKEGTTDGVVQGWLTRGREAVAAGEQNLYTWFLLEYDHAAAHFRSALEDSALQNIGNRKYNEKFIRWRLSISDPKNYTLPREAPVTAGNTLGPLFELVTPEQARARLDEKLTRFLEEHDKQEAAEREPPPVGDDGT